MVSDPKVLRGIPTWDDAGVYQLSADLAIIQTVDFFTPIVDDPYTFGQIAAANALSDVYTMGGKPLTAMNIVCFPTKTLGIPVLKDILRGGADKLNEAGVALVGGHSVEDAELKYGLSVTGTINPKRLVTSSGAKPGDRVILTKPIGTGIIGTAIKFKLANETAVAKIVKSMSALNNRASEAMLEVGADASTDITGFGLVGHAARIAQNSRVGIRINAAAVPFFPGAEELAKRILLPAGLQRNREFYSGCVTIDPGIPQHRQDLLFDPQTSGGLLIFVNAAKAELLLEKLRQSGVEDATLIGEVVSEPAGVVVVS